MSRSLNSGILLALMVILVLVIPSSAQEDYYDFQNPMKLPAGEMTLADVVDLLTEYSVEHQKKIAGGSYWGVTYPGKREIFISDEPAVGSRRDTVLHELYHAYYARLGYDTSSRQGEAAIYLKTHEHLVKLYRVVEDSDEK